MRSIEDIKLKPNATIKEALKTIENGAMQLAIVVSGDNTLVGTLSDGDLRRALLNNFSLQDPIKTIIHTTPTVAKTSDNPDNIFNIAKKKKITQIPIVDDRNRVIGIKDISEFNKSNHKPNRVILMVGGLGSRLRPLTEATPKPMLKVGANPILQTIVESFAEHGFTNITMCVNYKSQIIQDYFKDGSEFGVNIEYILEEERMGTAGALSLLATEINEPFFIMNGDLLTNVNLQQLLNHHLQKEATATMCIREYDYQIPYGVVNIKKGEITSIQEKPIQTVSVSAGIYVLSPEALAYIPKNQFFDMPTLFETLIANNKKTVSFLLSGYWLDIGKIEEYERANQEFYEVFHVSK